MASLMLFLSCACFAFPITIIVGVFYFSIAISIIDSFRLNYGVKPISFAILNWTFLITFVSYFVVLAALYSWIQK